MRFDVYLSIKDYVPTFLALFTKTINNSRAFIDGVSDINIEQIDSIEQSNFYETADIKIEIGTVHSAKGQTHAATLYLETFFQGHLRIPRQSIPRPRSRRRWPYEA